MHCIFSRELLLKLFRFEMKFQIEIQTKKNNAFQNHKKKLVNQPRRVNELMSAGRTMEAERQAREMLKICEKKSEKVIVDSDKKRKYSSDETNMGNHDEMQHQCSTNNCNISENTLSNALPSKYFK